MAPRAIRAMLSSPAAVHSQPSGDRDSELLDTGTKPVSGLPAGMIPPEVSLPPLLPLPPPSLPLPLPFPLFPFPFPPVPGVAVDDGVVGDGVVGDGAVGLAVGVPDDVVGIAVGVVVGGIEVGGVEVGGVVVGGVEVDGGGGGAVAQLGLLMTLLSRTTAPLRARTRPSSRALVCRVALVKAMMVPTKLVEVPSVAELPTCQNTLHA